MPWRTPCLVLAYEAMQAKDETALDTIRARWEPLSALILSTAQPIDALTLELHGLVEAVLEVAECEV